MRTHLLKKYIWDYGLFISIVFLVEVGNGVSVGISNNSAFLFLSRTVKKKANRHVNNKINYESPLKKLNTPFTQSLVHT
jgi:hypothetical protein